MAALDHADARLRDIASGKRFEGPTMPLGSTEILRRRLGLSAVGQGAQRLYE